MSRVLSIVVPVFNEAKNVQPLFDALEEASKDLGHVVEYVFVDDGSTDDSALVLTQLAKKVGERVKVVLLSRNFGKEVALSAGVTYARGEGIVTLDADLQHPPALLPELVAKWTAGADVVIAVRRATAAKSLLRRASSFFFRVVARSLAGDAQKVEGTDYRLIDAKVREAFLLVGEKRRAYRQIVDWLGFTRAEVPFDAGRRHEGTSTYSWPKLWSLAIDMIVSRSSVPLRMLLYLGVLISVASVVSLVWMQFAINFSPRWLYTPLAKTVVFNTLLNGIVVTALGVLGLYVARIHEEVLGRPLFAVRATIHCARDDAEGAGR